MGANGLWKYLEDHNVTHLRKGGRSVDVLLVDMNSIMHMSYRRSHPTVRDTIASVLHNLQRLITLFRPVKRLVVVFDGVAPVAKLITQKSRRIGQMDQQLQNVAQFKQTRNSAAAKRTVQESNPTSADTRKKAKREARVSQKQQVNARKEENTVLASSATRQDDANSGKKHVPLDDPQLLVWNDPTYINDTLVEADILTGSQFVNTCECATHFFLAALQATSSSADVKNDKDDSEKASSPWDALFPQERASLSPSVEVTLSGCSVPGEGEMKLSTALLSMWEQQRDDESYTGEDTILLVSNDSDVVLVGIASVPYCNVHVFSPSDEGITHVSSLLSHWLGHNTHTKNAPMLPLQMLPSHRIDFVFMFLLAGGDYYGGVGGDDAVRLWRSYRFLRLEGNYRNSSLVDGVAMTISRGFMRSLLSHVLRKSNQQSSHGAGRKGKKGSRPPPWRTGKGGSGGAKNADAGIRALQGALWALHMHSRGICIDYNQHFASNERVTLEALRRAAELPDFNKRMLMSTPIISSETGKESERSATGPAREEDSTAEQPSPLQEGEENDGEKGEEVAEGNESHNKDSETPCSSDDSNGEASSSSSDDDDAEVDDAAAGPTNTDADVPKGVTLNFPSLQPLELYVAVLGKYARVSKTLRDIIINETPQLGETLTKGTSLRVILPIVRGIFEKVTERGVVLPPQEQLRMRQEPPQGSVAASFMRFKYPQGTQALPFKQW